MPMNTLAFVFPGQGSQSVGMLDAYAKEPVVAATLAEASEALGQDLCRLIATGPEAELNLTTNTQPVMLAAGVALWRLWQARGGAEPGVVAGHSLGEYAALVAAGALELGVAVRLVRFRAEAMQEAVPVGVGGMAAVMGLEADAVRAVCTQSTAEEVVEAVNFNEPAQTVIAGHAAAVARACEAARAAGAKRALVLPVSAPFHSSLMRPAALRLGERLAETPLAPPRIPVLNNVDVAMPTDPAAVRDALVRQAWHPVRWVETIRAMRAQGITTIVECGPGKVLSGLIRRIDREIEMLSLSDPAGFAGALEARHAA